METPFDKGIRRFVEESANAIMGMRAVYLGDFASPQ